MRTISTDRRGDGCDGWWHGWTRPLLLAFAIGGLLSPIEGRASDPEQMASFTACFDVWPPYTRLDGEKPAGITIDLIRKVSERMGRPITITHLPWKRCLAAVEKGMVTMAVDAVPRDGYLRSEQPTTLVRTAVFALKGHYPSLQTFNDLPMVRVGRPLGWASWDAVAAKMPQGPRYEVIQAADVSMMMDMLRHDRIDIYVDDALAGRQQAEQHGLEVEALYYLPGSGRLYGLFHSGAQVQKQTWDRAVEALQGDGWLEDHYRRHNMM